MTDSLLFSFLERGPYHVPIGMETFYPHQVSWSSAGIHVFEWVFGEATVQEGVRLGGPGHRVTVSTLLLRAVP